MDAYGNDYKLVDGLYFRPSSQGWIVADGKLDVKAFVKWLDDNSEKIKKCNNLIQFSVCKTKADENKWYPKANFKVLEPKVEAVEHMPDREAEAKQDDLPF